MIKRTIATIYRCRPTELIAVGNASFPKTSSEFFVAASKLRCYPTLVKSLLGYFTNVRRHRTYGPWKI